MYESIFYKIGKKTMEVGGESFSLGKLTAEVLNITPQEHEKMLFLLEQAELISKHILRLSRISVTRASLPSKEKWEQTPKRTSKQRSIISFPS